MGVKLNVQRIDFSGLLPALESGSIDMIVSNMTPAGPVIYPEYEACREIAESAQIPLQQVYRAVLQGTEEKE